MAMRTIITCEKCPKEDVGAWVLETPEGERVALELCNQHDRGLRDLVKLGRVVGRARGLRRSGRMVKTELKPAALKAKAAKA